MHKSVALDAIGGDARTLEHSLRRTNRYSVTPFLTNRVSPAKTTYPCDRSFFIYPYITTRIQHARTYIHKSVALDAIGGDARTLKHSLRRTNRYSVTPIVLYYRLYAE